MGSDDAAEPELCTWVVVSTVVRRSDELHPHRVAWHNQRALRPWVWPGELPYYNTIRVQNQQAVLRLECGAAGHELDRYKRCVVSVELRNVIHYLRGLVRVR